VRAVWEPVGDLEEQTRLRYVVRGAQIGSNSRLADADRCPCCMRLDERPQRWYCMRAYSGTTGVCSLVVTERILAGESGQVFMLFVWWRVAAGLP
jgi:hypothetical protein